MIGALHREWKVNALSVAGSTGLPTAAICAPSVASAKASSSLTLASQLVMSRQPILITGTAKPFIKSDAQVETRVGPLAVAPPLSCGLKPKRKRASPIKVRLSEAEKELVRSKARQAGLSVNAFIKQVILDANYDPALRKALLAVYRELTAQGNNINQIARFVNSSQSTPVAGAEMVSNVALSVMQTHQAVRKHDPVRFFRLWAELASPGFDPK